MSLQSDLAALSLQAGLLEAERDALAEEDLQKDVLIGQLRALLAECQDLPIPPPVPPPVPGQWVPPMAAVQIPYLWGDPDVELRPGADIQTAYRLGARNIFLHPGHYGSQSLGAMPNSRVHSAYRAATFSNGAGAFVTPAPNMIVGGVQVENYGMHKTGEGGAMLASDGQAGQWFINLAVGKSKNNAYSIKGSRGGIRGGEMYDIARYGWAGDGADNLIEDLYVRNIATMTTSSNRGLTKTVFSQRHIIRRICGINVKWNGIWFDIQNQPALIEDVFLDGVGRAVVFIEVSYGGELQEGEWKTWRIRRVGGANPGNVVRDGEENYPIPAVIQISATPDVQIEDIYGSGWRVGVALLNPADHKQITGEIGTTTRSRIGLQNITVRGQDTPGTLMNVAALTGSAHTKYSDMKQPTGIRWVAPIWDAADRFRDFTGPVTGDQFRQRYV